MVGNILCFTIATHNGCSLIDEHKCHGFSYDIGTSDDNDFFSFDRNIIGLDQCHDAFRGTTPESFMPEKHVSDLCSGESIHIFFLRYQLSDPECIDMFRKRSLHDDTVDIYIVCKMSDCSLQFRFADSFIECFEEKVDPHFFTPFLLHAYISKACRVLTNENNAQSGFWFMCRYESNLVSNSCEEIVGNRFSVKNHGKREENSKIIGVLQKSQKIFRYFVFFV